MPTATHPLGHTESASDASSEECLVETRTSASGRVRIIILSRPRALHAVNRRMAAALFGALREADADPRVRVIVLSSSKGSRVAAFCAGADVKELRSLGTASAYAEDWLGDWRRGFAQMRKPVLAAVHGLALGGGCEIAMMCDVIYCSPQAQFGLPEITLGTIPGGGGCSRLLRAVGKSRAMEMILTGEKMDASEALQRGLVARVFQDVEDVDRLVDEVSVVAEKMAIHGVSTLMLAKEAVNAAEDAVLREGLNAEKKLYHMSFSTADFAEGTSAFVEKRKPNFGL